MFYFDKSGEISSEKSRAFHQIFDNADQFNRLDQFLCSIAKTDNETVKACLGLLWPAPEDAGFFSDFVTTVSMLPRQAFLKDGDRETYLGIQYRPIEDSYGNLDKVIVIVTDETESRIKTMELKEQEERITRISNASVNKESFLSFFEETSELIARVNGCNLEQISSNKELKRFLHTLKGSSAAFGFKVFSSKIHDLEDELDTITKDQFNASWQHICDTWNSQSSDIFKVLNLSTSSAEVSVSIHKLRNINKYVEALGDANIIKMIQNLNEQRPEVIFDKYMKYLKTLNERFPDKSVKIEFLSNSDEIIYQEATRLDSAFIHIFRNCFDHGIETCEKRLDCSKDETGTISIGVYKEDKRIRFLIRDDGGGIDGEKLAKKAVENGYWTDSQAVNASWEEKINLIFLANLSSKDAVSDVSGRGVGMDAVKALVEELDGRIIVKSELGSGSSFEISLPRYVAEEEKEIKNAS